MPQTTLPIKKFMLELQQHFVSLMIEDGVLREYGINKGQASLTRAMRPAGMANHFVAQLLHLYYSYEVERLTVRYPEDWWQAFRERWFPRWWLKKYPVFYTTKILKKELALTDFPMDDYKHKVFIRDISHLGGEHTNY